MFSSGTPAEGTANGVEVVPNSTLTWKTYSEDVILATIFKVFVCSSKCTGCTLTINDGGGHLLLLNPAMTAIGKYLILRTKSHQVKLTRISWKRGSVSTGGAWAIGAIYVDDSKLVDQVNQMAELPSPSLQAKTSPNSSLVTVHREFRNANARATISGPTCTYTRRYSSIDGKGIENINESGVDKRPQTLDGVYQETGLRWSVNVDFVNWDSPPAFKVEGILDYGATATQLHIHSLIFNVKLGINLPEGATSSHQLRL